MCRIFKPQIKDSLHGQYDDQAGDDGAVPAIGDDMTISKDGVIVYYIVLPQFFFSFFSIDDPQLVSNNIVLT